MNMETNQKLNALYDMFQTAGKERRVLADNQAKIMQKMRQGFSALCLSDYQVRKAEIEEAFKHANINFLDKLIATSNLLNNLILV